MDGLGSLFEVLLGFMDKGGNVLWLIAAVLLVMWMLIFERIWYLKVTWRTDAADVIGRWESRKERNSWEAHQIRTMLVSRARMKINQFLPVIKTLVALCPLLGLLGTVTGMIEVFNVMAVTGGGDAKSMAGGVQQATIPTMAGMVAALVGMFVYSRLYGLAERKQLHLERLLRIHAEG